MSRLWRQSRKRAHDPQERIVRDRFIINYNITFVFLGKNVDSKIHEETKDMISYLITRSYRSLQEPLVFIHFSSIIHRYSYERLNIRGTNTLRLSSALRSSMTMLGPKAVPKSRPARKRHAFASPTRDFLLWQNSRLNLDRTAALAFCNALTLAAASSARRRCASSCSMLRWTGDMPSSGSRLVLFLAVGS